MSFKVWIKSKAADRVLSPLRKELVNLIEEGASLLEVGCGTGDLLFQSAYKISAGYGIDINQKMIAFAEAKKHANKLHHLNFKCIDAQKVVPAKFDIATSTLCLHELTQQQACCLLKMMVDNSKMVLIADYTKAKSIFGQFTIEFDELLSGHYRNYKNYRNCGEIPFYAKEVGAIVHQEIASTIDGISIWKIGPKYNDKID